MGTHVDKDKVVQCVIQLLGEGLSDGDTGAATAEDHDVLDGRRGGHGGRRGWRGGANIEGCSLYILGTVDSALSKSRDRPVRDWTRTRGGKALRLFETCG